MCEGSAFAILNVQRQIQLLFLSPFKLQFLIIILIIQQRASQLRKTPFSGESTDSSDTESTAGDYCTPPDELSPAEERSQLKEKTDQVLEETTQVLKTCATYTTVSLKKVMICMIEFTIVNQHVNPTPLPASA